MESYQEPLKVLSGMPQGQEVIPECEVIFQDDDESLESDFSWCESNPKHTRFTRICDFKKLLPDDLRGVDVEDFISTRIDLTVRIQIPYTSLCRPDYIKSKSDEKRSYPYYHHKGKRNFTRNGTGLITAVEPAVDGRCSCGVCKKASHPEEKYYVYTVRTATHNVFDDEEAKVAVVNCFFNSEKDEFHGLFGICINLDATDGKKDKMVETDVCDLVCVSHSLETFKRISELLVKAKAMPSLPDSDPFMEVIVSHPHGCEKRISIGPVPCLVVPLEQNYKTNMPIQFPISTARCVVKSKLKQKYEALDVKKEIIGGSGIVGGGKATSKAGKEGEKQKDSMFDRNEVKIPAELTFTLPGKASYAMKYHIAENPRYLTFPPGTKFATPDGTDISVPNNAMFEIGSNETEDGGSFFPKKFHVGHIVEPCAGTGGAMVWSNLMEDQVLTDLEHSGTVRNGKLERLVDADWKPDPVV